MDKENRITTPSASTSDASSTTSAEIRLPHGLWLIELPCIC
ncbi:15079_t:CDS:2 [Racocetra persica]|uniref:15079_t:CDS:1 n=1 Tax=Racocetra persica TaxID=160502 RepID=A0ACA9LK71_9GLOM|nr:15079_t:CDS:2 [Racocetra persica]